MFKKINYDFNKVLRLKKMSFLAMEISWWDCGERRNGLRKSWLRNGCRMTEDGQRTDKELWNKGSKCIFQTSPCILIITYDRGWGGVGWLLLAETRCRLGRGGTRSYGGVQGEDLKSDVHPVINILRCTCV